MIIGDMEIRLRADIARLQRDMDQARQVVGGAMGNIGRAVDIAKTAIIGLGVGLSVTAFASWIKGGIDAADAASKLSAKTGIATKDLAGLQLAYDLGGAGGDAFTKSMSKLSNAIADGNKGLERLGIKTKDANGNLLDNKTVLYSVADAFAGMDNGAQKAALAQDIFSKSGADLIPVLNGGSEGLREMDEMARKLGLTISDQTAADAEKFNDTLDLMHMGTQGVARGIAAQLLPTLGSLAGSFLESMTSGDNLAKTANFLGTGLKLLYTVGVGVVEVFSTVGKTIGAAGAQVVAILSGDFKLAGEIGQAWASDIGTSWAETARAVSTAWDASGNSVVESMVKTSHGATVVTNDLDAAGKKAQQVYEAAVKSAQEFVVALRQEQEQTSLGTDQIKMMAAARAAAKAPTEELRNQIMSEALALDIVTKAWAEKVDAEKRATDLQKSFDGTAASVWEQVRALEAQIETFGLVGVAAVELERVKVAAKLTAFELSEGERVALESQIAGLNRLISLQGKLDGMNEAKQAAADLDKFLDPTKAQSFGDALRDAFGGAGSALVKLTSSLQNHARSEATFDQQRGHAAKKYLDGLSDEVQYNKDLTAISKQQTNEKLGSYGDMAGAAASFFGEQSKGYKILQGVSQAFHVAQLAMNLASIGPAIAAGAAQMFAQSGWGGFAGVAAMVGVMAALGAATSGGGGGPSAKDRQKAAGTGSILGDKDAKSESISRSLELAAANSSIELTYTRGMLESLRSIESSLSGLGNLLVRNSGLTGEMAPGSKGAAAGFGNSTLGVALTGGPFGLVLDKLTGGLVGKLTGSVLGKIFGGKVTTLDTGVTAGRSSLGGVLANGISVDQYTDIKKSGGLFSSSKNSTQTNPLGAEASDQFAKVIAGLAGSITEAGKLLGLGGDEFTKRLNSFVVDIGKISLKGLTGEEIQKQLETVFSKLGDDLAAFAVGGLEQFQQVGEGYFETLTRIATNYANLDSILAASGTTFGQVGLQSIAARERLIGLAGGIDELASKSASFNENFLTEAQRLAPVQKYVTDQLAAMGLAGIDTRDKFRDTVLGLANSGALATEAGAKQYAGLLDLAEAFAKVYAATEDLTKSQQSIADERKSLQAKLDELTMTSTQLRERERATIAAANLALYDSITAAEKIADARAELSAAYDRESGALKSVIQAKLAEAAATKKQMEALKLGALSTLSPEMKLAEAKRQFDAASGAEKDSLSSTYLEALKGYYGSTEAYAEGYAKVQAALALSAASSSAEATVAQQQLTKMDKQAELLLGIKGDTATFAQALASMTALIQAGGAQKGASNRQIEDLYATLLGRQADASGLAFWSAQAAAGASLSDLIAGIKNSPEYIKLNGAHANGGIASGWSLVGEEGPEVVNFSRPGRVYTASQTREMMGGGGGNSAAAERQAAALERQNVLLEQQNELLTEIRDSADAGATGEDIRSLKQHMAKTLSQKVPA